ncbi:protease inhibitor I42 family protein [Planosporangium thailandense]|uniref:Protease inhibitor I42 family protein n=1 Tax=Planosporangium thailandense TaxID=765197 RepID=A0ABX0XUY2_9ACTN|nr:protease inhibitor I42 family protein [Planosporangium thailandense]NJC69065.1 protease inhibitor I42 family protein [Planosporangium thailandense]
MLRRRWWLSVLAAVAVIGLIGVGVARAVQRVRYGDIHTDGGSPVVAGPGHRFALAVPDRGASVGDHWTATVAPDGIVALVRSEQVAGNIVDRLIGPAVGGGAGTRYFVFAARRAGTVVITLHNCFRGCDRGADRRDTVWAVTVR